YSTWTTVEVPRDNELHEIATNGQFQNPDIGVSRVLALADNSSSLLFLDFLVDGNELDRQDIDPHTLVLGSAFMRDSMSIIKDLLPMGLEKRPDFLSRGMSKSYTYKHTEGLDGLLSVNDVIPVHAGFGSVLVALEYKNISSRNNSAIRYSVFTAEIVTT